jgi:hypothetical protein
MEASEEWFENNSLQCEQALIEVRRINQVEK